MTTEANRAKVSPLVGGAGRGARAMLPTICDWNSESEAFTLAPRYADPLPGRARQLAERAQALGVPASYVETQVKRLLTVEDNTSSAPVVLHVDRPAAIAEALLEAASREVPLLGYLLVRLPDNTLVGVQFVFQAHEAEGKLAAAALFDELAEVTARSGASEILGERGRPEHLLAEPIYRAQFGRHLRDNLRKLVAGIEPESHSIEFTFDGQNPVWTGVVENRRRWADPGQLAGEVLEKAPLLLVRGTDFAVVELGPRGQGLRIHRVHCRTDGRLSMQGSLLVDAHSVAAAAERELLWRQAEQALQRASRATLSRKAPIFTTD